MKKVLVTLILLVAFVAMSSAREFPVSDWNITVTDRNITTFIKKNPAGTVYCTDVKNFDVATGKLISDFRDIGIYVANGVDYDAFGNTWVICAGEGVYRLGIKDTILYTTANGLPSVANLQTIEYDKTNNRLLIGAVQGLSIGQLDNTGKLASSFQTAVGGVSFHAVGYYGKEIWAVNTTHVYYYDGTDWKIYSKLNSIVGNPAGAFVTKSGDAYIACDTASLSLTDAAAFKAYIACFSHSTGLWTKIVPDSGITWSWGTSSIIPSVVVDNKNTLWFTCTKYLVSVDLNQATPTFDKTLLDGSVLACLNNNGSTARIAIGSTDNGDLLISCNNAIIEAKSANAVRNPLIPKLAINPAYQSVREYDLSGRLITTYSKSAIPSFSFSKSAASSMHIFVFQNAVGQIVRTEKATIIR
jgi:hypothetical protein